MDFFSNLRLIDDIDIKVGEDGYVWIFCKGKWFVTGLTEAAYNGIYKIALGHMS